MAEEKGVGRGLVVGGVGGTLFGALIATLLAARPAEAAPPDEKIDYLIECLTALVQVLAELAERNATLITLLEQWLAAQGVPPAEGIEVTVKAPWVAKEPEQIFRQPIRSATTIFYSDKMVDWTQGKRLLLKVESTLDQVVNIQVIGNTVDDTHLATDIGAPHACLANGNISIGPAWDDWHPFIGVRITVVGMVDPAAGFLTVWATVQE